MIQLADLRVGMKLSGLISGQIATITGLTPRPRSSTVQYKTESGGIDETVLFADDLETLQAIHIVEDDQVWQWDGDAAHYQLVTEAQRIRLAHLFDPYLAIYASQVEPLPHQITAVYEKMLNRQPLKFLLADDPGAGKTIMAGLLIKELFIRGDVQRCLIVCPGSLAEQWQEELKTRFHLDFRVLQDPADLQNIPFLIGRLDKLARNPEWQTYLKQTEWDLIVVDEAHKMSASFSGGEVKYTKRFSLGRELSNLTRHFLLMTATPHNGKEEDFQLFLSLLDADRFEGKFRQGVEQVDVSDLMRRMVKEQLLKFDGRPLFPERIASTMAYDLSDLEQSLYEEVTKYVKEQFNRADKLEDPSRKGTIGFALTILQRRLASSPAAISSSLRRRRERLEKRLQEVLQGQTVEKTYEWANEEDWEDVDDLPAAELEQLEEELNDQATSARTIDELRTEINSLQGLEALANKVYHSGKDRKWEEVRDLLQSPDMYKPDGQRRKLVIFTEHGDTLHYLVEKIRTLLGKPEAVVIIHGGISRPERLKAQEAFTQNPEVHILLATDAAGEGINLQRAHLMINYDLPWNPNRLEQRFGRIHRIGQTEVCHLWNLVAVSTREGEVYQTLLHKLNKESEALKGSVFDVLGKAISGKELRQWLVEAIRYGERPDVKARLQQEVEGALDKERLQELLSEKALADDLLPVSRVQEIREEMERREARRLQPHFIEQFFRQAFELLNGNIRNREAGRAEITYVPAALRQHHTPFQKTVATKYERICFDKKDVQVEGKPQAELITPGHPLLDALIQKIVENAKGVLSKGAILVDPREDVAPTPRYLFALENVIKDGRGQEASRRLQFVEIEHNTTEPPQDAGYAPHLDYRPLTDEEAQLLAPTLPTYLEGHRLVQKVIEFAIENLASQHLAEVKQVRLPLLDKIKQAVEARLKQEILYWTAQMFKLQADEQEGKINAKLNSARAWERVLELQARLDKRCLELEQERKLRTQEPLVWSGALIIPAGLLNYLAYPTQVNPWQLYQERKRIEQFAMAAVTAAETALGYVVTDVSRQNKGYDLESHTPVGQRFLEVKGVTSTHFQLTRNERLTAANVPTQYMLALVKVPPASSSTRPEEAATAGLVRYVRNPFGEGLDEKASGFTYEVAKLWAQGFRPEGFWDDE